MPPCRRNGRLLEALTEGQKNIFRRILISSVIQTPSQVALTYTWLLLFYADFILVKAVVDPGSSRVRSISDSEGLLQLLHSCSPDSFGFLSGIYMKEKHSNQLLCQQFPLPHNSIRRPVF